MLFLVLLKLNRHCISIESLAKVFSDQMCVASMEYSSLDAHSVPHSYLDSAIATFV